MNRIVTATEANQHFSEIMRAVSAGDSYTVTNRGRPVARILPPEAKQRLSQAEMKNLWEEMDRYPPIVTGPWTRDELYDR